MAGTFVDRVQLLRDNVGAGHLEGKVEVDQLYAAMQHFHPEFKHPDGGKAYYLRDPLYADLERFMQHLAENALAEEGRKFSEAMMENMETLSRSVHAEAPWEFADLRASGHPSVTHEGAIVHDRPPHVPRLTKAELKDKKRLSRLFDPQRYA